LLPIIIIIIISSINIIIIMNNSPLRMDVIGSQGCVKLLAINVYKYT